MIEDVCKEHVFKKVFSEHATYLRNFLMYKSGSKTLSEDLVQDAFGKLWENCSKVSIDKAKSYLFTTGLNLLINIKNREKLDLRYKAIPKDHTDHQSPEFLLESEEFKKKLLNAIQALDEDVRMIYLMNRVDKKKYREIAEILNISQKTVEKKMHIALKSLRMIHKKV